jgi:iron-sulfur cluster repair protein YtfE (RIC family)
MPSIVSQRHYPSMARRAAADGSFGRCLRSPRREHCEACRTSIDIQATTPNSTKDTTMTTATVAARPQTHDTTVVASPRLDLYAPIHKALRNFMCDTLCRVGRIDVNDVDELQQTLAQCDQLLALCEGHVHHENDFMHPAIDARQPAGSKRIAHEHEEHLQSIAELRDEVAALRCAADPARALRLYRHLALFVADNFRHMHIEETAHNAALWAHYSDAELMQLHGRLMASIDPREHLLVARWMLPALTPGERKAVVGGMKADAPPEAFLGLMAHVRPHLSKKTWVQLAQDFAMPRGVQP